MNWCCRLGFSPSYSAVLSFSQTLLSWGPCFGRSVSVSALQRQTRTAVLHFGLLHELTAQWQTCPVYPGGWRALAGRSLDCTCGSQYLALRRGVISSNKTSSEATGRRKWLYWSIRGRPQRLKEMEINGQIDQRFSAHTCIIAHRAHLQKYKYWGHRLLIKFGLRRVFQVTWAAWVKNY